MSMAIARLRKDGTQDMPCSRSTHSALAATHIIRLRPTLCCISHAPVESNEAERRSSQHATVPRPAAMPAQHSCSPNTITSFARHADLVMCHDDKTRPRRPFSHPSHPSHPSNSAYLSIPDTGTRAPQFGCCGGELGPGHGSQSRIALRCLARLPKTDMKVVCTRRSRA